MSIFDHIRPNRSARRLIATRSFEWLTSVADPHPVRNILHRNHNMGAVAANDPTMGVTTVRSISFHPCTHLWDRRWPSTRFALVYEGGGWLVTRQIRTRVKPGMFFTRLRHEEHCLITDNAKRMKLCVVMCSGGMADRLHNELLGPNSMASTVHNHAEIRALFEQILDDGQAGTEQSQQIAGLRMEILLRTLNVDVLARSPAHGTAYRRFRACREYVNRHAAGLTSASQLAEACHLDLSYLGRLFRRFELIGPYEYLTRVRMGIAADMLIRTDQPIRQIAAHLHFTDAFTFSRAFKRVLGVSPSDYRSGSVSPVTAHPAADG